MRLATRLDRYPAKMVSHLAERLVDRYARGATRLLDPFCGSSAILHAAHHRGIEVSGVDLNPLSGLFASVKLRGFNKVQAATLAKRWISAASCARSGDPVDWPAKDYWFTRRTLEKYERLRATGRGLMKSKEGLAVLMSYALSVRLCSRADQRSPKPFISKIARVSRGGRHHDPFKVILDLLSELSELYGDSRRMGCAAAHFHCADLVRSALTPERCGYHSHIITSPPYINAQDYFRNFKLELHLLEGLLPFEIESIKERFIGTERGQLLSKIDHSSISLSSELIPQFAKLESRDPRLAAVVVRYVHDMDRSFEAATRLLEPKGKFILVCGDNLVGGIHIATWLVLQRLLERHGFELFDRFSDSICDRQLPPTRSGHKGLIKREVISAFKRSR